MITREIALSLGHGTTLYHRTLTNRDGSAVRARVNGRCQVWKRRPTEFRLPMKHGLRDCFYLEPSNAADWLTDDPSTTRDELRSIVARFIDERYCRISAAVLPSKRGPLFTLAASSPNAPYMHADVKDLRASACAATDYLIDAGYDAVLTLTERGFIIEVPA